jgi:hypothetical protein
MPTPISFQEAWQAYQQALRDLYRAPEGVTAVATTDRGPGEIYIERLKERSQAILNRAEAVRSTLEESLQTDDLSQRDLAALKLLAAAAYDLSAASDLLALEAAGPSEGGRVATDRSAAPIPQELRLVLEAPLDQGMRGLVQADRAALPNTPGAAWDTLQKTVSTFLVNIPDDAAELGQTAMGGVVNLGLGPIQMAASLAAQEVLARVPEGLSLVARRVAALAVEGLRKLRAALGEQHEQQVRETAAGWLKDLQEQRDTVTALLDRLYETQRLGEETKALIPVTPEDLPAARYNQATQTLNELIERYAKTKSILINLMRVLSFVKAPLLGAVPWGPLALYTAYVGIMGYAVYSGGDYLDWYRTGDYTWLDRVQGLRTTVRQALSPAESAGEGGKRE